MDIETKLNRFSETVRKEAETRNELKIKDLDEKYNKDISEFEKKTTLRYNEMRKDVSIQAEKLKQKKISDANAEVKRALMQIRADYVQKVFSNVLNKLNDYFKTNEYEQFIIDHIAHYKDLSQTTNEIRVQIMERDLALKDSIISKCGVKVETVDEDFLGGVRIILDESRIADCTLKSRFDAEKAKFNKIRIL